MFNGMSKRRNAALKTPKKRTVITIIDIVIKHMKLHISPQSTVSTLVSLLRHNRKH
jgi:hypothetical protein